ncbi:MAG: hypothetical protein E7774_08020 [Bradyrhizobium sp.]|nr:MAG: hypothetical protein E7774_08020 [Bradyrhizobium sp.]
MGVERNRPTQARAGEWAARSTGALLLIAGSLAAPCALAAPASGDVTIDNLTFTATDGDAFTIPHVEFDNTNLTKDEIVKLFSPDTPVDEERALALKLKADKIAIASIDILGKDNSKIHLSGLNARAVDSGKMGILDLASISATGPADGGTVSVNAGALHVDGLDAPFLLADASAQSASLVHLGGLTLNGIDIVAPDFGGEAGQTDHIAIASVVVQNRYTTDVVSTNLSKVTGVVFEASAGSDTAKELASLGYPKLELSLTAGFTYDEKAQTLTFGEITIDGAQMGSIGFQASLTNVAPALFGGDRATAAQALIEAGVASLQLKLVNAGLFDKGLAYLAKQEGVASADLRKQWSTTAGTIAPVMLGGDPSGLALGSETQKFIADPKSLSVVVKAKSGAIKAGDFMTMGDDPTAFVGKLDITAAANR